MPVGDWQFWVVSLIAAGAAAMMLRRVVPVPGRRGRAGRTRVRLTVSGRAAARSSGPRPGRG
ncbi:MAG: hypothetical protein C0475_00165 [Planctomyces sp.]|nr:hypothetical protein [Planctomyces sp.]MBA4038718.1 hypothetical protein [Planctomyces sp.]